MAIALDTTSSSAGNTGTPITFSHTTSAVLSNLILLVYVDSFDGLGADPVADRNVSSITYGGQALIKACEYDTGSDQRNNNEIWYLVNPPTGANNIVVTMGGTTENTDIHAVTFAGVNTSSPLNTSNAAEVNGVSTMSISETTTVDGCLIYSGCGFNNNGGGYVFGHTGLTSTSGGYIVSGYSIQTSAGSITHSYKNDTTDDANLAIVAIAPYVAPSASTPLRSLMGIGT